MVRWRLGIENRERERENVIDQRDMTRVRRYESGFRPNGLDLDIWTLFGSSWLESRALCPSVSGLRGLPFIQPINLKL